MGIRTCCVKRENEEDRNLQKVLPNNNPKKIYERNDNTIKVENGGFFTVKTTEKIFDLEKLLTAFIIFNMASGVWA